jgi:urea ABC transporter ATP-binding protein UrtD
MDQILQTKGLTKRFGGLTAVDDVALGLDQGELRCIIGPNGCGKTTLFNLITGALSPSSGRVVFAGTDITGWPVRRISRLGIGRKFQVPAIFEELTVFDNMRIPFWAGKNPSMLGRPRINAANRRRIMDHLEQVNLAEVAGDQATNLSHGQKQWLEIGMVLASRPRLILLDEPTAGMTVTETQATANLIRRILAETGLSILVIEHDIGFVKEVASKVTVMFKGSIFKEGTYDQIQADEEIHRIYLGRRR